MGCNRKYVALWTYVLFSLLMINFLFAVSSEGGQSGKIYTNISKKFLNTLSENERIWLQEHPVISVALDLGWSPVEFVDENGKQCGMSVDYLELVEQRLGMKFKRVENLSWAESYKKLQNWEIDMTTSVAVTPQRLEFWSFTKPYMNIPIVIAAQSEVSYIADLRELSGKDIAVVEGYAIVDWIPKDYPEINMVKVKTALEGLRKLQRGEVFGYIDNLLIIGDYQAKMQISNIKIAGNTPYLNAQCMAVRKDWAVFAGILQKALESISETERNEIYRRWLPVRYEHGFNYKLFWQVAAIFMVVVLTLLFWNRKLAEEIRFRKKAEEENIILQEQLNHSQKMESIGRLAGGVAHDFNNMLMVIMGNTEIAMDSVEIDSELYQSLAEIKMAATRSADLTRQLLAFARQQTVEPKVIDLNKALDSMLKMLKRLIGENIELVWHKEKELWKIKVDPSQIDQILANLCVNAKDAINERDKLDNIGRVTIKTENISFDESYYSEQVESFPGNYVRLSVSDDGCGIEKKTLTKIFDPFFTTKELGRGTGLGLATIYGIVKQNKGFVNVYSEPGKGTTFNIYLPQYIDDFALNTRNVFSTEVP